MTTSLGKPATICANVSLTYEIFVVTILEVLVIEVLYILGGNSRVTVANVV